MRKNYEFSNRIICIATDGEQWFRFTIFLAIGGVIISMIALSYLYFFSPETLLKIGFAQKIFDKNLFGFCEFFFPSSILGGLIIALLGVFGHFFFLFGVCTFSVLLNGSAKKFIKLFFNWLLEPMTSRRKLKKEIGELTS
jgi:hypothetical protein